MTASGSFIAAGLLLPGTPEDLKSAHRSAKVPDPTLEDAFVDLIEGYDQEHPQ